MLKKIKDALDGAYVSLAAYADGPEQAAQLTTAYALIAIAEALLEERKWAEFATEVEEVRQERQARARAVK